MLFQWKSVIALFLVMQLYFCLYKISGVKIPTHISSGGLMWILANNFNLLIDSVYILSIYSVDKSLIVKCKEGSWSRHNVFVWICISIVLCGVAYTLMKYSWWPAHSWSGLHHLLMWEMGTSDMLLYRWITDIWWRCLLWCSCVGVLGPALEEVIYRGMLQGWLHGVMSRTSAVLVSSFVFAVNHDFWFGVHDSHGSFSFVLEKCVSGCIYGALYACTGSLPLCIAAHSWWNLERLGRYVARYYYYNLVIPS